MSGVAWTKAALDRSPRIITRRSIMLQVVRRWKEQYPDHKAAEDKVAITRRLEAIDLANCVRDEIDDTIGNDSWTRLECGVCEMDRDRLVSVPREYSEPVSICAECAEGVASVLARGDNV